MTRHSKAVPLTPAAVAAKSTSAGISTSFTKQPIMVGHMWVDKALLLQKAPIAMIANGAAMAATVFMGLRIAVGKSMFSKLSDSPRTDPQSRGLEKMLLSSFPMRTFPPFRINSQMITAPALKKGAIITTMIVPSCTPLSPSSEVSIGNPNIVQLGQNIHSVAEEHIFLSFTKAGVRTSTAIRSATTQITSTVKLRKLKAVCKSQAYTLLKSIHGRKIFAQMVFKW
ncbi:MAG: hypothetical protein VB092_05385 [Oscillospiraceae bacterium]|nr:hypothetical protein [Oscillospiraceae bacterium]